MGVLINLTAPLQRIQLLEVRSKTGDHPSTKRQRDLIVEFCQLSRG